MTKGSKRLRNPGPVGGYHFIIWFDRCLPASWFQGLLRFGVWIAFWLMPRQRAYSREYLRLALGHEPSNAEIFRHFLALSESLVAKLRIGRGQPVPEFHIVPNGQEEAFVELARSERPALFGTFHVGYSDLTGCMIGQFGRRVRMVRQRVGNAYDLTLLQRIFGEYVEFVWINEGESLLFALKSVAEDGVSLALQCDREEHGSRHQHFDFMGARRRFPVTIYHLAHLFRMPVVFSFGFPGEAGHVDVLCSRPFEPTGESKKADLQAGYLHFQEVLHQLEVELKKRPYMWFNFLPMNSEDAHAS
ncbi:hypothetical protein [Coraliomargarita parva]|uniref:hypothetical protein n=1 Tax=Coraliomargarita parva TaxID=3014050 RepID=UPI0022B4DBE7|nr:hypothetical protein [Coraliomargarita parva]